MAQTTELTLSHTPKLILHVDVLMRSSNVSHNPDGRCNPALSEASISSIEQSNHHVAEYLCRQFEHFPICHTARSLSEPQGMTHIARLTFGEVEGSENSDTYIFRDQVQLEIHQYLPKSEQPRCPSPLVVDGEERSLDFMTMTSLPNKILDGEWEQLAFDTNLHFKLLHYLTQRVGTENSATNGLGLILLHGPPGTGKTSLCRALAQKASIRLTSTITSCILVEVNAAGLLSKFIAQSQQQLSSLFETIESIARRPKTACFVLVDEVESIASDRQDEVTRVTGNREAMRATNRLLTLLDSIKHRSNIAFLFTTNMVGILDKAFMTRIPVIEHISLPDVRARYTILQKCFRNMLEAGIIDSAVSLDIELPFGGIEPRIAEDAFAHRFDWMAYRMQRLENAVVNTWELSEEGRKLEEQPISSFISARGLMQAGVPCLSVGVLLIAMCTHGLCGRVIDLVSRSSLDLAGGRGISGRKAVEVVHKGLMRAMEREA